MRNLHTIAAVVILVAAAPLAIPVFAQTVVTKDAATVAFVREAAIGNEFEIMSSKVALDRSDNPQIDSFARRMIDDHTKVGDDFRATLANTPYVADAPDMLDDKHQDKLDRLKAASEQSFDSVYVDAQLDAHVGAVRTFRNYAREGKVKALRDFAAKHLPTLEQHEEHILSMSASY